MPGETLEELYKELNEAKNKTFRQTELLTAIQNINEYTLELRRPDRFGRIPYVTAEQKQRLMELHKRVAEDAAKLLEDDNEKKHVKAVVKQISALASSNFTQVAGYNPPKEEKTLDTLEEEARVLTLDTRGMETGKERLGGALNSRQVLSFLNPDGQKVTGIFTPKQHFNAWGGLSELMAGAAAEMEPGPGRNMVSGFMDGLLQLQGKDRPASLKKDQDYALYLLCRNVLDTKASSYRADLDKLALLIGTAAGYGSNMKTRDMIASVKNAIGTETLMKLGEGVTHYMGHIMHNIAEAEMPDNSRVDIRNAAVSATADLLGVPNLVVRTRPMKIIGPDGKIVDGIFMDKAEGLDPSNLPAAALNVGEHSVKNTNGKGMKDLADLQALDFICGNVDRHYGNMFYQFDSNHKLIGVQGIDSDCAFGLFVPGGSTHKHLPGTDNMRCVSQSMYNRIMALDGATLKYALRGFELSEQELDAAVKRLDVLQKALTKGVEHYAREDKKRNRWKEYDDVGCGHRMNDRKAFFFDKGFIRVVPDKEFYRVRMEDVKLCQNEKGEEVKWSAGGDAGNTFDHALRAVYPMAADYRAQRHAYKTLGLNTPVLGESNRCRKENLGPAAIKFQEFVDDLDKRTRFGHSSGNYRDMQRAAKALAKFQRSLQTRVQQASDPDRINRPGYKDDLQAVVRPQDLKKLKELSENLEKAATKYLRGKGILAQNEGVEPTRTKESYKEYTRNRIEEAETLREFARVSKVIKPEEADMAQVSERRAKETMLRRLGDAAEQKYLDKHPQEKQQRIEEEQEKLKQIAAMS